MEECPFCRIVKGDLPSQKVYEGERVVAFRDIRPQAPVHVLVIPRRHVGSLLELGDADGDLAGELLLTAVRVARQEGLDRDGFRLVVNTGWRSGQTVGHLHIHVLGGRIFRWPPG